MAFLPKFPPWAKKFDFLIGVCDSALWLDRCNFLPLGTYQHCISMSREHRLASKKRLRIEDLYGETLMMVKQGDSDTVDAIRAEILKHPQIHIADAPQFYDIEVFNQCEQSQNLMVTIECWKDVHPALVHSLLTGITRSLTEFSMPKNRMPM